MRHWEKSDRGKVRSSNQDCCGLLELSDARNVESYAAVVCDGMGGAKAGNVASGMALECFNRVFLDNFSGFEDSRALIERVVREANSAIYSKSESDERFAGMGTTLVAAVVSGDRALVANIGDSRCYIVGSGGIRQLTKDHSVVEEMVDRGEITRADAWLHPRRNYITRALGTERDIQCDIYTVELESEDMLLLCTDGLSGVLGAQEILFELIYGGERETAIDRLIDITLARGAPDNVTAVLISMQ
ncbi:MAG: Stp1/IreP family PP2C-type Ser/Thr phosphatase [Oscillospiraceae bacterium]|nr:Stp1/IreP family PP2C-type Ser/Thr phosphatase [Oscillospiraceae bacterium]